MAFSWPWRDHAQTAHLHRRGRPPPLGSGLRELHVTRILTVRPVAHAVDQLDPQRHGQQQLRRHQLCPRPWHQLPDGQQHRLRAGHATSGRAGDHGRGRGAERAQPLRSHRPPGSGGGALRGRHDGRREHTMRWPWQAAVRDSVGRAPVSDRCRPRVFETIFVHIHAPTVTSMASGADRGHADNFP